MPYSTSYLLKLASRGKRPPNDTPEEHLWVAIRQVTSSAIDNAIRMGASVNATNNQRLSSLHQLLDMAVNSKGDILSDPRRVLLCAQALLRHNADVMMIDPRTGQTALQRAALLASSPAIGSQWKSLWRQRGNWTHPLGADKLTATQMWDAAMSTPTPTARKPHP